MYRHVLTQEELTESSSPLSQAHIVYLLRIWQCAINSVLILQGTFCNGMHLIWNFLSIPYSRYKEVHRLAQETNA